MRTHLAAHVEREFHFIERLLKIGGRNGADHEIALVTYDVGLITSDDAVQTSATFWISEIRVRERGSYDLVVVHAFSLVDRPRLRFQFVAVMNTEDGVVAVVCSM